MKKHLLFIAFLILYALNSFNPNMMEQFQFIKHYNIFATIIRYLLSFSFILIPISIYYKDKNASSLLSYVALPSSIISLFFINEITRHIKYKVYFIIIYVLLMLYIIGYSLYSLYKYRGKCDKGILKVLLVTAILVIPLNILACVHVNKHMIYRIFRTWYFIFLILFFAAAFILYYYLKRKSPSMREKVLLYLSLSLLFHLLCRFSYVRLHSYQEILDFWGAMPFYVCSFGIVILPFAIISRNKVFQTFSFLINTPGSVIVFVNPSMGQTSIFNFDVTYFIVTHLGLFAVASMLPIYLNAKVEFKPLVKSIVALFIYFVVILFINYICFKYLKTDYNFSYVITPPLPVDVKIFGIINYKGFKFSPLYILILWLVHVAISYITYLIYKYIILKKINNNNELLEVRNC